MNSDQSITALYSQNGDEPVHSEWDVFVNKVGNISIYSDVEESYLSLSIPEALRLSKLLEKVVLEVNAQISEEVKK